MTRKSQDGRITTHVLDTGSGTPAQGMTLELRREEDGRWRSLGRHRTNEDGRCDAPLLAGEAMIAGQYEILFDVAGWQPGRPGFYRSIPVRFAVTDPAAHHHVPLILSGFGYSTYRGS